MRRGKYCATQGRLACENAARVGPPTHRPRTRKRVGARTRGVYSSCGEAAARPPEGGRADLERRKVSATARKRSAAQRSRNFATKHPKPADKPGSVMTRGATPRETVIHLGAALPRRSSRLPADSASSVVVRLFGVAPDGGCRVSPASRRKRLVSVALFLAFATTARPWLLRPGVTRHPALRSPDFPLPRALARGSDDLEGFGADCTRVR
jgi:hypothetical protein